LWGGVKVRVVQFLANLWRASASTLRAQVEASFLADVAVVTVGERTLSFSREPTVPPLNQVSELEELLAEIDRGGLSPAAAADRLASIRAVLGQWSNRLQPGRPGGARLRRPGRHRRRPGTAELPVRCDRAGEPRHAPDLGWLGCCSPSA
jgi:hypothetical protein